MIFPEIKTSPTDAFVVTAHHFGVLEVSTNQISTFIPWDFAVKVSESFIVYFLFNKIFCHSFIFNQLKGTMGKISFFLNLD